MVGAHDWACRSPSIFERAAIARVPRGTLSRLAIDLQAVAQMLQHFAHGLMTDRVSLATQLGRQRAHALAGPAQWRHRMAPAPPTPPAPGATPHPCPSAAAGPHLRAAHGDHPAAPRRRPLRRGDQVMGPLVEVPTPRPAAADCAGVASPPRGRHRRRPRHGARRLARAAVGVRRAGDARAVVPARTRPVARVPESAITRMAGGLRMPPIRTSRHLHSDCPATRRVLAGRWIHEFFE
jgi:hypothetical protein